MFKVIPHRVCRSIVPSDFSSKHEVRALCDVALSVKLTAVQQAYIFNGSGLAADSAVHGLSPPKTEAV